MNRFHPHYDGRFAEKELAYHERKVALSNLIQTYLATMNDLKVETWLMHGTLLGWWWNRKVILTTPALSPPFHSPSQY
jgi:hypothetical protein